VLVVGKNSNIELQLSGIIGTASHPDMQNIRKIGLFVELQWQFELENTLLQPAFEGHVFISVQIKH
jgi:hypothetical protein